MNIDDLKQSLVRMADEVDPLDEKSRLRAVDAKVSAARQRRVGAGVGVVTAGAAMALVISVVVDGTTEATDPADTTPTTSSTGSVLPVVEDKGVRFYTAPAGDTLVGESVGRPGQRSVTLRVVAPSTDLTYQSDCRRPGVAVPEQTMYSVTINGHPIVSSTCGEESGGPLGPGGRFGSSPRANRTFWRDVIGVVASRNAVRIKRFTDPFWARCFVTYSFNGEASAFGSNNLIAASR